MVSKKDPKFTEEEVKLWREQVAQMRLNLFGEFAGGTGREGARLRRLAEREIKEEAEDVLNDFGTTGL